MHRINQHCQVVGIDIGCDPMAEIEHMSRPVAITGEHFRDALLNRLR